MEEAHKEKIQKDISALLQGIANRLQQFENKYDGWHIGAEILFQIPLSWTPFSYVFNEHGKFELKSVKE